MKFNPPFRSAQTRGYALVLTLCFLGVMLIIFASMMTWTTSNSILTARNNIYNQTQFAAESATETAIGAMINDFRNNSYLRAASIYQTNIPNTTSWPVSYIFSDTNGVANQISVVIGPSVFTNPQNLAGFGNYCTISAMATPVGQQYSPTGQVTQSIWVGTIPLFQYAIFYNMDMELNPGNTMTVNGRVHGNQHIWTTGNSSSQPIVYNGAVDAALGVFATNGPYDPRSPKRWGNDTYNVAGNPTTSDTITLPVGTSSTNNNPTNVLAILNPPPLAYTGANAYTTNGVVYLENAAELIITNSPIGTNGTRGTNITVYFQDPLNTAQPIVPIQGDVLISSNVTAGVTNTTWAYSFVTNGSFFDYRQNATVQSVDVDVAKLNAWATTGAGSRNTSVTTGEADTGGIINTVYVINSVPQTGSQMPAVRMLNGQRLPSRGLTLATPDPIYVKGNYNITTNGTQLSTVLGDTTNTYPAALLGDAITLLSSNWSDTYNSSTQLTGRTATTTTLNAATLEGVVPSNGTTYSGGVENFLRLLEDWGGSTINYNGSIVVMFPSQHATAPQGGSYYGVPSRQWGFDPNFTKQSGLPPHTPEVLSISRVTWSSP